MSPTIFRTKNLRIVVRTNDHGNPHVHVIGPGAEAKIYLNTFQVEKVQGFTVRAISEVIKILKQRNHEFLERWYEVHEEQEEDNSIR